MDKELIGILSEMSEHCAFASKTLIESEIKMNDGEVQESQDMYKKGISHLKNVINDTFKEIKEKISVNFDEPDYDELGCLYLADAISDVIYYANSLISILITEKEDVSKAISEKKLLQAISLVEQMYDVMK